MRRRDFIKTSAVAGIAGSMAVNSYGAPQHGSSAKTKYDIVGLKGGEPAEMFDRGIRELGGMSHFVKRGQSVVIKPNIGWSRNPASAANTNPDLVQRIAEHCFKAGAKSVYIFDHTCNSWRDCYDKSGMNAAAAACDASIVCGNHSSDYREIDVPQGKRLKKAKVHRLILDSDVFINVPVLKNHGGAVMTCAMKNLMGIVWDRGYFHKNDLQQCIADMVTARPPDLNIVDAYRVMTKHGPRGHGYGAVVNMKYQLISTDIVAIDTAASKVIGIDTDRIPHIRHAEGLGLGSMALDKMNIKRIKMG
jgi:uncharacterized protein (DUF362 family)